MESNMRIQSLSERTDFNHGGGGKIDRLSSLPDGLLTHIISNLPTTKETIQTSILATRWKYLWTCVPQYKFVHHPDPGCSSMTKNEDNYKHFMNIVDRLFHLRDGLLCMEKISVKTSYQTRGGPNVVSCQQKYNPDVDAWISSLIRQNIKKINLKLPYARPVRLFPSTLFTSKTLVSLKLIGGFKLNLSTSSIFLPNLKVLGLIFVRYLNEETLSRLLLGCPILELLIMTVYANAEDDIKHLNIAVPSLKWLHFYSESDFTTIIDARNLKDLQLIDYASQFICVHKTSSLVSASVDVLKLQPNLIGELLLAISDVQILRLGCQIIGNLESQHLPTFRNVRDLTLRMNIATAEDLLTNILESMPKIQKLIIEVLSACMHNFEWSPPEDVPVCLSSHLKTIEIGEFMGLEDDVKLVKYFLKNGKVLEKMTISPPDNYSLPSPWVLHDEDRWLTNQEELLKSPLGSSACQLIFKEQIKRKI